MGKKLALIHTVNNFKEIIYDPFGAPFAAANPDIEVVNFMDDTLLKETLQAGYCTEGVMRRIFTYVQNAASVGCDCAMVTCTSVNAGAKYIRPLSPIPVFNIDEPVAKAAVAAGKKIGVLATLPTSPKATIRLLEEEAAATGKEIEIVSKVAEGAFDVLCAGDRAKHDEMVCECLYSLAKEVDIICFAQISMSLLKHEDCGVPIFKIGPSGFDHAKEILTK